MFYFLSLGYFPHVMNQQDCEKTIRKYAHLEGKRMTDATQKINILIAELFSHKKDTGEYEVVCEFYREYETQSAEATLEYILAHYTLV